MGFFKVRMLDGPLKGQVVERIDHLAEAEVAFGLAEWPERGVEFASNDVDRPHLPALTPEEEAAPRVVGVSAPPKRGRK